MMDLATKQQRAIERAQIRGGAKNVVDLGNGFYQVTGRAGDLYGIRVEGSTFLCECEAGLKGCECWHKASVWLYRLALQTIAPAPAPATPPISDRCAACRESRLMHDTYRDDYDHGFTLSRAA